MRKRILLGASVAIALAFSWAEAQAQWFVMPSGPGAWYFGIEGGWTALSGDPKGKVGSFNFTQKYDSGYNIGARAGYEWGPLRLEEEFNFGTNHLTGLTGSGGISIPITGQRNRYALMTNAIYDFPVGWIVSPHIGVGIGAVNLHDAVSVKPLSGIAGCAGGCTLASSSTTEFGYQGIAG